MSEDWNVHLGNIFTVYCRADRWDREFGMTAYENYRGRINVIVDVLGTGHTQQAACGAFAALSPNIDEASNFLALRKLMEGEKQLPRYPLNIAKARRILEGVEPLDVLVGNKTRAFYQNIWKPEDDGNPVVVDAHMFSVWDMKRHKVTNVRIDNKLYHRISKDFVQVARHLGLRPNQLQATCWSTWKRVNDIVFGSHQTKLEWGEVCG